LLGLSDARLVFLEAIINHSAVRHDEGTRQDYTHHLF